MTVPLPNNLISSDWNAFLQRKVSPESRDEDTRRLAPLSRKRVLVTGAGGCIGSALARSIAQSSASEIVLLDASERNLYDVQQSLFDLRNSPPHFAVLGSFSDLVTITRLFNRHQPEIIFHAAAFKHVPLMEDNPFAAIDNNAIGTQILVEAAAKFNSEQLVMVSTDKAVAPSSIMGASKRIAELIVLAPRTAPIRMKAVRLGNVLGSSGSVVPLFERQIAQGGPVTVSHPEVRRYFMTLEETVDVLLAALSADSPTGLSVPQLGEPLRILDLAKLMIGRHQVPIVFTQLRPGDKIEESLISGSESYCGPCNGLLRPINSPTVSIEELFSSVTDLQRAILQTDLPFLLKTVQRIVPEYRPSAFLSSAARGNV